MVFVFYCFEGLSSLSWSQCEDETICCTLLSRLPWREWCLLFLLGSLSCPALFQFLFLPSICSSGLETRAIAHCFPGRVGKRRDQHPIVLDATSQMTAFMITSRCNTTPQRDFGIWKTLETCPPVSQSSGCILYVSFPGSSFSSLVTFLTPLLPLCFPDPCLSLLF